MIKTKIRKNKKAISKYPYVGNYKGDNTVVLFISYGCGTVIASEDKYYKVGDRKHNLNEDKFIPTCIVLDSTV